MNIIIGSAIPLVAGSILLAGCAVPTRPVASCDGMRDQYREKGGHKALVVDARAGGGGLCSMVWDRDSAGKAIEHAFTDCRSKAEGDGRACTLLWVDGMYNPNTRFAHTCESSLAKFSTREGNRVMVLGDDSQGSCYSSWGRENVAAAIDAAMQNCRTALPHNPAACVVVAINDFISALPAYGSLNPESQSSGGFGDFLSGVGKVVGAAGMVAGARYNDPGMIEQGAALMGGDANEIARAQAAQNARQQAARQAQNSGGAGGRDCAQHWNDAEQARQRQNDMKSVGHKGPGGTTGQAGAQNDMYNLHMRLYKACISQ